MDIEIDDQTAEELARQEALNEFHLARSKALNAYAGLERHLAQTFCNLAGTNLKKGMAIFAAIQNPEERLKLIRRLTLESYPGQYDDFVTGFRNRVAKLITDRNHLVHWIVEQSHRGGEAFDAEQDIFLADHPDLFQDRKMYRSDIAYFQRKSHFYSLLIFYFSSHLDGVVDHGDPNKTPWPEIFREAPVYPPPLGHQLDRFSAEQ